MPRQNLGPVGIKGLNSDTPAQKLDLSNFTRGLNMRPFDGSLQGVFNFTANDTAANIECGTAGTKDIYAMTQWTPTGSRQFNLGYLHLEGTGLEFQLVNDLTLPAPTIRGAMAPTDVSTNPRFGVDLFAFNDVLIVNDGVNQPIVVRNTGTVAVPDYNASYVLGWPGAPTPLESQLPLAVDASITIDGEDLYKLWRWSC